MAKVLVETNEEKRKYNHAAWHLGLIRPTDLKVHWVRIDVEGTSALCERFDMDKSAYIRKLDRKKGDDPHICSGGLSLVPAHQFTTSTKIQILDGKVLVTAADLIQAKSKNFDEKREWFQDICAKLRVDWETGHMRINARREHLLKDSIDAIMSLSEKDLRKRWRFELIGERGISGGGLLREWFYLVAERIFDPALGLWQPSASNSKRMDINPDSGTCRGRLCWILL
jgi:hypothetical protein